MSPTVSSDDNHLMGTTLEVTAEAPARKQGHPLRFWAIIVSLSLLAFISALDTMIISTALPTITREIGGEEQYIWIANSFVFASSVLQPLCGQLADILGRKIPTLISIILFIVGSGIGGGATDAAMLIAGRTVQGVGAGGIYVLIDIVCCDLVPLRDRGTYLGIINAWAGVAAALGPVLGGVLAESNWRWIFYMNIPICALPLATITLFMHTQTGTSAYTLRDVDVLGTSIFVPSIIAILLGLVTGGVEHPWSSWRIILPIVLGVVGWVGFHLQQHFFARNPCVPSRLFNNRTSTAGYMLTFLGSVQLQTAGYFLPIYFQAVLRTTVSDSGIYFLPTAIGTLLFAVVAGVLLSKYGKYKPIHAVAFALSIVGFGLFTLLSERTSAAGWVCFQLVLVAGLGMTISTILPAILAGLSEADVAAATAVFSFIKTFGFIWGVTVPSIIFIGIFNDNLHSISSPALRGQLENGRAYAFASEAHQLSRDIDPTIWGQIVDVYTTSLDAIWWFGLAMGALALLFVGLEKSLELSTELKTDYGIEETTEEKGQVGEAPAGTP
ncbi:major facilitator superfamily domain-containing protein [Stachybotrys elegans]|uniref:Major facilitator superfamily domain-containing protein n=1 Tax=Stachybotrys elegans TaxID=80388 RepID=A0A8K0WPE5_9HYPO|nr:major facilitator superfamily domain-containing protein [Stachybotrys elegans]